MSFGATAEDEGEAGQVVQSEIVLTQRGSELKRPSESIQLTCATSGFVATNAGMDWVRQKPGKGLEWLVYYWKASQTNFYSPTIRGRFTASKDSSNFYLQMNSLEVEDTAVYFCTRDTVREKQSTVTQKPFTRTDGEKKHGKASCSLVVLWLCSSCLLVPLQKMKEQLDKVFFLRAFWRLVAERKAQEGLYS
ncbi:UNVERIFIED_CONTAM: hypothetical protein K2H54_044466 [Gekko kuhli]